jgi:predicted SnoaL-like aldol condensation-catalyzing enzyme
MGRSVFMAHQGQLTATDPLHENKQTIRGFYDLAFTQRRPNDAATFLCVPSSPLANPLTSPQAHAASISGWLDTMPRLQVKVLRLVAEGDLVVAHSNFVPAPGVRPMLVMDMFRLRGGKIVEHWDALQEVHGPGLPPIDN